MGVSPREDLLDQVLGSGDHLFIGQDHSIPGVISQAVAIVGAVFTGKAVCSDVPAGHILQLHLYQGNNIFLGHIGGDGVGGGGQDILVAFQNGRGGRLIDDALDYQHLVAAPLHVAIVEGVPLTAKASAWRPSR